jgi:Zn-dependent oligopeptidase
MISLQDFADNYKEGITNDLNEVIANLEGVASLAAPALQTDLQNNIAKLDNARKTLCDVPPPCTDIGS